MYLVTISVKGIHIRPSKFSITKPECDFALRLRVSLQNLFLSPSVAIISFFHTASLFFVSWRTHRNMGEVNWRMVIVLAQFSLIQQPFFVPSLSHLLVPSGCNVRPEREIMNGYQVSTALNSADIVPYSLVLSTSRPPSSRTEYSTGTSELRALVLNPFVTPPRYTY